MTPQKSGNSTDDGPHNAGAVYLDKWQEFLRLHNKLSKIQRRAKLKELNEVAVEEAQFSFHPDWRIYCKV